MVCKYTHWNENAAVCAQLRHQKEGKIFILGNKKEEKLGKKNSFLSTFVHVFDAIVARKDGKRSSIKSSPSELLESASKAPSGYFRKRLVATLIAFWQSVIRQKSKWSQLKVENFLGRSRPWTIFSLNFSCAVREKSSISRVSFFVFRECFSDSNRRQIRFVNFLFSLHTNCLW